jgi:hypothetical protein
MVSDWFQDVFGISNFTIAKAMIMSAFIIVPLILGVFFLL